MSERNRAGAEAPPQNPAVAPRDPPQGQNPPAAAENSGVNRDGGNGSRRNHYGNRNNNRNRNRTRSSPQSRILRDFKGLDESLPVLGTKVEGPNQNTVSFARAVTNKVLNEFKEAKPIAKVIAEMQNLMNFLT